MESGYSSVCRTVLRLSGSWRRGGSALGISSVSILKAHARVPCESGGVPVTGSLCVAAGDAALPGGPAAAGQGVCAAATLVLSAPDNPVFYVETLFPWFAA